MTVPVSEACADGRYTLPGLSGRLSQWLVRLEYTGHGGVWSLTKTSPRTTVVVFSVAPIGEVVFDRLSLEKRLYSANHPLRTIAGVRDCPPDRSERRPRTGRIAPRHPRPLPSPAETPAWQIEGAR